VDLSAPWLTDPSALFPEDNLQLENVIPSRERSKELDLIDLSLLSEAAHPARPNYEEEEATDQFREVLESVSGQAEKSGPEAPRPVLVESQTTSASMTPTDEGRSPRYMSYAKEEDLHLEEPPLAQEDPVAPYDYPGCLQADPCPRIEEKTPPAAPKAAKPPSTPSRDRGADARPTGIKYHTTLKKSIPSQDDTSPTHPEVDTMEFRPTDAGSVDFLHRRQIY
jgi:hypothetical protein